MMKVVLATLLFFAMRCDLLAEQPVVRVEPPNLQGTRPLQKQTADAAIRDYLLSWQSLRAALEQNRPDLLEQSFVGTALDKLKDTVGQQTDLGLHTSYQDRAHDLRVVFYSPDGLSIQLVDNAEYDQQVFDHDKLLATERQRKRYIVVLTPTEVRWRVRVFQLDPNERPVATTKRVVTGSGRLVKGVPASSE
jgi:hypothetical protein